MVKAQRLLTSEFVGKIFVEHKAEGGGSYVNEVLQLSARISTQRHVEVK